MESVIGKNCECLITGVYKEDGTVIAIPIDDDIREMARHEARNIAMTQYKKLIDES